MVLSAAGCPLLSRRVGTGDIEHWRVREILKKVEESILTWFIEDWPALETKDSGGRVDQMTEALLMDSLDGVPGSNELILDGYVPRENEMNLNEIKSPAAKDGSFKTRRLA